MDSSMEHVPLLQRFLHEIGYRYTPPPPGSSDFLHQHHYWMHHVLGPLTSWSTAKLSVLEDTSATIFERAYPFHNPAMKFLLARLTAIAIFIDDSLDDDAAYDNIGNFAHRLYLGDAQPNGVLTLYHQCIQELSSMHSGDTAFRGLAVTSWITFIDACILEKRLLTVDPKLGASPHDMGYHQLLEQDSGVLHGTKTTSEEAEVSFPIFLRHKSGIGEAYATAIFKTTESQELPLSRFVKCLPDVIYFTEVANDLLSFHKEQLAGETANMIHLQHRSWKGGRGTGRLGQWTLLDTFSRLCNEVRDAVIRVDEVLRLEDCEMIARGEKESKDVGLSTVDVAMALQWRAFRDGYVTWHLECPRYRLDFMMASILN